MHYRKDEGDTTKEYGQLFKRGKYHNTNLKHMTKKLLKFQNGNAKLEKGIFTFSLPSGFTCPGAKDCLAKVNVDTGKMIDGPHQKFRCFSATMELRPNVRAARWYNLEMLKKCDGAEGMAILIAQSIPPKAKMIRIHVGGDFFSQTYFDAWLLVAESNPNRVFYAYTKSIPFVKKRWDRVERLANFRLTSSEGGNYDEVGEEIGMFKASVVLHPAEAEKESLEIDHDDSHAILNEGNFALLIHGVQPKDSEASGAINRLKSEDVQFSYSTSK